MQYLFDDAHVIKQTTQKHKTAIRDSPFCWLLIPIEIVASSI